MSFEEAKKIDPNCYSAYYKLGYSYRMIGQNQEALKNYLALEKIAPNYARIHSSLGSVYYDLGMFQKAIGKFKIALRRENIISPRYKLRKIYQELGKKELAERESREIKKWQEIFLLTEIKK